MVYPALLPLLPLMRTPRLPVVDWTDAPTDLNGLVRFAERRNLVSCACAITFQLASALLIAVVNQSCPLCLTHHNIMTMWTEQVQLYGLIRTESFCLFVLPSPPMVKQPLMSQGLLIVQAPRSPSDTSVCLLWTSDQPDAETSTWHTTVTEADIHAPGRIRTRYPSKQAVRFFMYCSNDLCSFQVLSVTQAVGRRTVIINGYLGRHCFSSVSIMPLMLHTDWRLRANLIRRTIGRRLEDFNNTKHMFVCLFVSLCFLYRSKINIKGKVKCTVVQALRLCTGRTAHRGIEA